MNWCCCCCILLICCLLPSLISSKCTSTPVRIHHWKPPWKILYCQGQTTSYLASGKRWIDWILDLQGYHNVLSMNHQWIGHRILTQCNTELDELIEMRPARHFLLDNSSRNTCPGTWMTLTNTQTQEKGAFLECMQTTHLFWAWKWKWEKLYHSDKPIDRMEGVLKNR